jgi:hypothetical protein
LIFWDKGQEELVVKINYQIDGRLMPEYFGWVLTVPDEPTTYAVADQSLFDEMRQWLYPSPRSVPMGSRAPGSAQGGGAQSGLVLSQPVSVGPYQIQPIRALGRSALKELNGWLAAHGFSTKDTATMAYFVDKNFTFLCVKVVPKKGQTAVPSGGDLPPIQLSFKSPLPYYPLRFSSRQGVFDVSFFIFTKQELDYEASSGSLEKINWSPDVPKVRPFQLRRPSTGRTPLLDIAKESIRNKNRKLKISDFPPGLKRAYSQSVFKRDEGPWVLNVIKADRVNENNSIASSSEDLFFKTRAAAKDSSRTSLQ